MKRILVTGSEGFIGKPLVSALKSSNLEVFTLDILPGNELNGHFAADIVSADLNLICNNVKPDAIIHLAAQIQVGASFTNPELDLDINGKGTVRLIEAAISSGCNNFCYIHSGGAVYDSNAPVPVYEDSAELPQSPYGLTKRLGEDYVKVYSSKFGFSWSSLALSNCYGQVSVNQKGVIYQFWKALTEGKQAVINGREVTRDFVHVDDVVRAIILAVDNPTNCRVNISSAVETSLESLYEIVSSELGVSQEPDYRDSIIGEIRRSCLSNEKAKKLLGWSPEIDIVTGIKASIKISGPKK